MKTVNLVVVLASSLGFACLQAEAQETDPLQLNPASPWYKLDAETGWHFDLKLGAELEPTYAGSKNTNTEADVGAQALYRSNSGHRYFIGLGEIGGVFSLSPNTQFLAFLESEGGREASEDSILQGLDTIDDTIEGQFTLARRFGNRTIFATLQPDLAGDANKGLVWFVGAGYDWLSLSGKWRFASSFDISGADSEYMTTEFGITSAESQRTGYRTYTPNSGLKSATFGLAAEYYINDRLSILNTIEIESYLDNAKDSPLIKDLGDATNIEASAVLRWRF